jgi:hypothetical protein
MRPFRGELLNLKSNILTVILRMRQIYFKSVTISNHVKNYFGCLKRSAVMYIQKGSHTSPVKAIPT